MIDKEALANKRVLCAIDSDNEKRLTKLVQYEEGYHAHTYELTENGPHDSGGWGGGKQPADKWLEYWRKRVELLNCTQCKHRLACLVYPECDRTFEARVVGVLPNE